MHVLRFGNKLNEEVCRGFIFANLGFGRQSEKFSRIGACIRRNFTPSVFSIMFFNTFLMIMKKRTCLTAESFFSQWPFLYSRNLIVWLRSDNVRRNWMLVPLWGQRIQRLTIDFLKHPIHVLKVVMIQEPHIRIFFVLVKRNYQRKHTDQITVFLKV